MPNDSDEFIIVFDTFITESNCTATVRVLWAPKAPAKVIGVFAFDSEGNEQEIIDELSTGQLAILEQRAASLLLARSKAVLINMTTEGYRAVI